MWETTLKLTPPDHKLSVCALLVTLAAFGPYLSTTIGVRTEQPVFFSVAFAAVIYLLFRGTIAVPAAYAALLLLGVILVAFLGTLFPTSVTDLGLAPGSLLAGLTNNLEPLAGLLIATFLLASGQSRETVFRSVSVVVVWAMIVNAVIAIISLKVNIVGLLQHFYQASTSVDYSNSVAIKALGQGRYTGIFDQPAQAGFLYGLALLFTFSLWKDKYRSRPIRFTLLGMLLVTGGILTVSKIFLFIALPLAGLLILSRRGGRLRSLLTIFFVLAALLLALNALGVFAAFPWERQLAPYLHASTDPLKLFTAGRLGSQGSIANGLTLVTSQSPLGGFGLAGLSLPYDSALLEVAITAGYAGLVLYGLLTFLLVGRYLRKHRSDPTNGLMFAVLTLTILSSVGFPVSTGNRISGILWIVLTVLFLSDLPWRTEVAPLVPAPTSMPRLHPS